MQRISAFGRLSPLALTETQAYINHRLATAGYQGPICSLKAPSAHLGPQPGSAPQHQ